MQTTYGDAPLPVEPNLFLAHRSAQSPRSRGPMAPPSSLLRDLLSADGFKSRRKRPDNSPAAPRTTSMPQQSRRPTKPARSQSDVLTRSRLRDANVVDGSDGNRDGAGEDKIARRRSSASLMGARSYRNIGTAGSGAAGSARGCAAVPAMDESALSALISLAAGAVKQFARDEAFRASLRGGCTSCVGESDHRAVLDLRVTVQTIERSAAAEGEDDLDPRDLRRASLRLHALASLETDEADAVTASGAPYERLAACAHLYMSVVSKLQKKDHSSAVHALEAFCLAPREARTVLLPALWDRLLRPGLSHLRAWRDRESAAAAAAATSDPDARVKEVERTFVDALDEGTRELACYYRDWLLGRTDAMALPSVTAPPSTTAVLDGASARFSASTSYDIGSDVAFSSGSLSPAVFTIKETPRQLEEEVVEEVVVEGKSAEAESVFHECDDREVRSYTPTPQSSEEKDAMPKMLTNDAFEPQIENGRSKGAGESTSYLPVSDMSAIDLLTLEFCEGPLQISGATDGNQLRSSIFATTPSDFLCPLTRQIFNRPVTIETGQTFERHAIVQWFDRGLRTCPVTGQELESLSVPDTNRVLKRLIDGWKSEHCKNLQVAGAPQEKLNVAVVDRVLDAGCSVSEQMERARHLMGIGGVDFHLHRFREGVEEEQKTRAAEHLLLCIRAEGGCRNYVAVGIDGGSVVRLLHSEVVSARTVAVRLIIELLRLRSREMVELLISRICTESVVETMDAVLQHLRSSPVEEQALIAVLLLHLDRTLKEPHISRSIYREEAARTLTESLRRGLTDENVVPNTGIAMLMLGGHFYYSGNLFTEHWMLKQAGFIDEFPATSVTSDTSMQDKEVAENEAWQEHVTAVFLGSGRRPFLAALSDCLGSGDAGLVSACLTTAVWLSRSLAAPPLDDARTDMQLAAFSALVPRLKRCLDGGAAHLHARHRVLAAVTLHNFSKIPDCRVLLMLLADGMRGHLAELAELTRTAGQLYAELHESR